MENNVQKSIDRIKQSASVLTEKLNKISEDIKDADTVLQEMAIREGFYKCVVDTPEKQVYFMWKPTNIDDPKGSWRIFIQIDSHNSKQDLYKVFCETKTDIRLEYYQYLDPFLEDFADYIEKIYKEKVSL